LGKGPKLIFIHCRIDHSCGSLSTYIQLSFMSRRCELSVSHIGRITAPTSHKINKSPIRVGVGQVSPVEIRLSRTTLLAPAIFGASNQNQKRKLTHVRPRKLPASCSNAGISPTGYLHPSYLSRVHTTHSPSRTARRTPTYQLDYGSHWRGVNAVHDYRVSTAECE
jgi:hypothetical protein